MSTPTTLRGESVWGNKTNLEKKMKKWIFVVSLILFCGCKVHGDAAKRTTATVYRIETSVPDIWDAEPRQSVKLIAEFRR